MTQTHQLHMEHFFGVYMYLYRVFGVPRKYTQDIFISELPYAAYIGRLRLAQEFIGTFLVFNPASNKAVIVSCLKSYKYNKFGVNERQPYFYSVSLITEVSVDAERHILEFGDLSDQPWTTSVFNDALVRSLELLK